jgi:hypothetical protein
MTRPITPSPGRTLFFVGTLYTLAPIWRPLAGSENIFKLLFISVLEWFRRVGFELASALLLLHQ